MKSKKWNRQMKGINSENKKSDADGYKVRRVPIRKRRKKHCGYTKTTATNYVYFDKSTQSDWGY